MSSILKALKKLEEEQAGRSASASTGSSGQFVAPTRAGQPLLLLMFGIGAGLLLAGGLYALLGRSEDKLSTSSILEERKTDRLEVKSTPAVAPLVTARVADTAPPAAPPVVTPSRPTAAVVAVPRAATVVVPAAAEERIRPAVASAGIPSPEITTETRPGAVEPVQVERREIPLPGQQWTAPQLTVSEILPTAAEGRMAIVNGMPVMEGTMVDGVLVENIGVDQVVFVIDGRTVVVPLGQQQPADGRQ